MKRRNHILAAMARHAMEHAHAPYSRFRVGSALLAANGLVYSGCNVEVSSYGLTQCAERVALHKAYSEGVREFHAIAIVSDDAGFTPPCGACRQVMLDLAGNIDIIMVNGSGKQKVVKLDTLLPYAFNYKHLKPTKKRK